MNSATHHSIREAIRARIVASEWQLGELIPGEADFAQEYGCSRTTVNRALQALAEEGIVERKRKGGTRVRPLPVPQVQLRIPIIREEVEDTGKAYASRIMQRELSAPPAGIAARLGMTMTAVKVTGPAEWKARLRVTLFSAGSLDVGTGMVPPPGVKPGARVKFTASS